MPLGIAWSHAERSFAVTESAAVEETGADPGWPEHMGPWHGFLL
jgi:hypothetical protein